MNLLKVIMTERSFSIGLITVGNRYNWRRFSSRDGPAKRRKKTRRNRPNVSKFPPIEAKRPSAFVGRIRGRCYRKFWPPRRGEFLERVSTRVSESSGSSAASRQFWAHWADCACSWRDHLRLWFAAEGQPTYSSKERYQCKSTNLWNNNRIWIPRNWFKFFLLLLTPAGLVTN